MKRTKKAAKNPGLDPAYRQKMKVALRHTHRQVILLNNPEQKALDEYFSRLGIKTKGPALRRIIMEAVLKGLDESQPTLF